MYLRAPLGRERYKQMRNEKHIITVPVNMQLMLDAGWWQECAEDDGTKYRLIYPPEQTLFEQILLYLESILKTSPMPPGMLLSLEEQTRAAMAVCPRWGLYFAVLADQTKPLWPLAKQPQISCITDAEMARINIEASAALEQWIDLMRTDYERYCALAWAAKHLPMPIKRVSSTPREKERRLECAFFSFCLQSLHSPQGRQQLLASREEKEWVKQKEQQILLHPTRFLANGIVNKCWRNGSGIENIHAGMYAETRPLLQRRITKLQDQKLTREACEMLSIAFDTVHILIAEQSEDTWATRILPFGFTPLRFSSPGSWALNEKTRQVKLHGSEP